MKGLKPIDFSAFMTAPKTIIQLLKVNGSNLNTIYEKKFHTKPKRITKSR